MYLPISEIHFSSRVILSERTSFSSSFNPISSPKSSITSSITSILSLRTMILSSSNLIFARLAIGSSFTNASIKSCLDSICDCKRVIDFRCETISSSNTSIASSIGSILFSNFTILFSNFSTHPSTCSVLKPLV